MEPLSEKSRAVDAFGTDNEKVEIVEVSPRDGLQNEQVHFTCDEKIKLIEYALAAGMKRIEVTSFVNPKRVPQMADADELSRRLPRRDDVQYIGLVLNKKGAERAIDAGLDELGAVCVASETFAQKNQGQSRLGSGESAAAIVKLAHEKGLRGTVTIGASFGCPFEGEVPHEDVIELAIIAVDAGADEISLADTIGVGDPWRVQILFEKLRDAVKGVPLRAHFHNTRNTGFANAYAAYEVGVRTFDSSFGGIGGCPFAPAATGNIATEDLIYMLSRGAISTNVKIEEAIAAGKWLSEKLQGRAPGMLMRAGSFPETSSAKKNLADGKNNKKISA